MQPGSPVDAILRPARLWTREEVLGRPCPVPRVPGVYGWYFRKLPREIETAACVHLDGMPLLYVGISPSRSSANGGAPPKATLRSRLRTHYRGNASGSTLRLTLGILLGLPLSLTPGRRITFGADEAGLSEWMAENAFVTWATVDQPWVEEERLLKSISLPLNLRGNELHPYATTLARLRSEAWQRAKELAVGR